MLEVGPDERFDQAVSRLLDLIEPHGDAIAHAVEAWRVEPQVALWWRGVDETVELPETRLPKTLLKRIARLGADLDIDV